MSFRKKIAMDAWLFMFVHVVTWIWVVGERGRWNLLVANCAGFISGWIVGWVFVILYQWIFAGANMAMPPIPARSLLIVMSGAGALVGMWMWVAQLKRPESSLLRHLIGAVYGTAAGAIALLLTTRLIYPGA
jgi:hypothetical protein